MFTKLRVIVAGLTAVSTGVYYNYQKNKEEGSKASTTGEGTEEANSGVEKLKDANVDWSSVTTSKALHVPSDNELTAALTRGLKENFRNVSVSVVECPDLTKAPFSLASTGICGSPRLADVGGVPNLVPVVKREKLYNLKDVAVAINLPHAFFVGAGAGSSRVMGTNCELMPNTSIRTKVNNTHYARVDPETNGLRLDRYGSNEFGLLGNFLASEGHNNGKVVRVEVSDRTGEKNFVSCMREALATEFGEKPDFSETPLNTDEDVEAWLNFYNCHAPLTCLSVFISHDPGLDLRVEHTHCFSAHGEGGHYHYDTTPRGVKYVGYFSVAEEMYRVDPPAETHMVGRD